MMEYLREITGNVIYPYPVYKMREDFPETAFPDTPNPNDLAVFSIYRVVETEQPAYDPMTQNIKEGKPRKQQSGSYKQTWTVTNASETEIQDRSYAYYMSQIAIYKKQREGQVAKILVTTTQGNVFDGDEISQGRMARAILSMEDGESTLWVMANNTPTMVSKLELREALRMAGQAQTSVWVINAQ